MNDLVQDMKYAVRMLLKAPGFAVVAILTLALGIGANTAIFSVVYGVLLRPLDYGEPERLTYLFDVQEVIKEAPFSAVEFLEFQSQNSTFENLAGARPLSFNLTGEGAAERVRGTVASSTFFDVIGVHPVMGRGFSPDEGKPGAPRVAVLSHGMWQRRFGGDKNILGRVLTLNQERVTVIGVMPPSFGFMRGVELWMNPRHHVPEVFPNYRMDDPNADRGIHYLPVIGRLKKGVTLAQAQADLDAISKRITRQNNTAHGIKVASLYDVITGDIRPTLLVLLGAVGFVLLIACANTANLLLARAAGRQKEIAIRTALGATRARIVRQSLTESALLGLIGGTFGLALAQWGVRLLVAANPDDLPRVADVQIDAPALAFTLGISLLTAILFGLAPAVHSARIGLNEAMKEGSRGSSTGAGHRRVRGLLVISEVALSLVLLIGAGLLIKSFVRLLEVKPGFNPAGLTTMWVNFSAAKYQKEDSIPEFVRQVLPRLEAIPGVQGVALANDLPLEGQDTNGNPTIEGRATNSSEQGERDVVGMHDVNADFFRTMGIPLLRGRTFTLRDGRGAPHVAVINEAMAKRFWPNEDPIGKRFRLFTRRDEWSEVIGVVGNVRHNGLSSDTTLEAYAHVLQSPWPYAAIVLRSDQGAEQLAGAVRAEVAAVDPQIPVHGIRSMDRVVGDTLQQRRITLGMIGLFAALALTLAAVGIYGVMAYNVAQRTHEIGIRVALGAARGDVLRLVVGQGMKLALVGLAVGIPSAFALTRLMEKLLFGVKPTDPVTFALVAIGLTLVALAACWVPAMRAARVDPLVALRYE